MTWDQLYIHADLVRAGIPRVRQEGKCIGRPTVIEREGFLEQFAAVVTCLAEGTLSRSNAARELDIGYAPSNASSMLTS